MNNGWHIFGLRHHSNVHLYPSVEELAGFLVGPAGSGSGQSGDLAVYRTLIDDVRSAERLSPRERLGQTAGRKVYLSVLNHTRFASPALAAEVEHYRYFLHALRVSDVRKPTAFIRAADEEMAKLDPRKKASAERLHRLRQLSDGRKRDLQGLLQRREALSAELVSIVRYVRDNLVAIRNICRTSLALLSDVPLAEQIEQRLVEEVKEHFRIFLKSIRDRQAITPEYLGELKADVATLGRELTAFRREAAAVMQTLYRSLLRHADGAVRGIEAVLARIGERRYEGDTTDQMLFGRIEQHLITLVTGWSQEVGLQERATTTFYTDVFIEKKEEALASLFDLVRGERRAVANRRSGRDRRALRSVPAATRERRSGVERRSGKERREEVVLAY